MPEHLEVTKTSKLFINGAFVRSESGATLDVSPRGGAPVLVCRASAKDLRDAVEAARAASAGWAAQSAYGRGQILYRMAEMLEGRHAAFADAIRATAPKGVTPAAIKREVDTAIDRLVCFAGWTDKYAQILGGHNPVAGPYYNVTLPEPTGVIGVAVPERPSLLALVSLVAPPLCAGNTLVAMTPAKHPLAAALFAEVCATSDVPAGVVNILTAGIPDLLQPMARHRDVDAITAAGFGDEETRTLRLGTAENVKRVHVAKRSAAAWFDSEVCESPWTIEPFVQCKTIWHSRGS